MSRVTNQLAVSFPEIRSSLRDDEACRYSSAPHLKIDEAGYWDISNQNVG